jgi:hypothetical protein
LQVGESSEIHLCANASKQWVDNAGEALKTKQDVKDVEDMIKRKKERLQKQKTPPDPKVWDKPRKVMIFLMPTYKPKKPTKPN